MKEKLDEKLSSPIALINSGTPFDKLNLIHADSSELQWLHIKVNALFLAAAKNDLETIKRFIPPFSPGITSINGSLYIEALKNDAKDVQQYLLDIAKKNDTIALFNILLDELQAYTEDKLNEFNQISRIENLELNTLLHIANMIATQSYQLDISIQLGKQRYVQHENNNAHPCHAILEAQNQRLKMLYVLQKLLYRITLNFDSDIMTPEQLNKIAATKLSVLDIYQLLNYHSLLILYVIGSCSDLQNDPAFIKTDAGKFLASYANSTTKDTHVLANYRTSMWRYELGYLNNARYLIQMVTTQLRSQVENLGTVSPRNLLKDVSDYCKQTPDLARFFIKKGLSKQDFIWFSIESQIDKSEFLAKMANTINMEAFKIICLYLSDLRVWQQLILYLAKMGADKQQISTSYDKLFELVLSTLVGGTHAKEHLIKPLLTFSSHPGLTLKMIEHNDFIEMDPMIKVLFTQAALLPILNNYDLEFSEQKNKVLDNAPVPVVPVRKALQPGMAMVTNDKIIDDITIVLSNTTEIDYKSLTHADKSLLDNFIQFIIRDIEKILSTHNPEKTKNSIPMSATALKAYIVKLNSRSKNHFNNVNDTSPLKEKINQLSSILNATYHLLTTITQLAWLRLPHNITDDSKKRRPSLTPQTRLRETSSSDTVKVLYAEDEIIMNQAMTKQMLDDNHLVVTTTHGVEAIIKFRKNMNAVELPFNRLLIDRHMPPCLGGICTLELIRACEDIFELPNAKAWIHTSDAIGLEQYTILLNFEYLEKDKPLKEKKVFFGNSKSKTHQKYTLPPAKDEFNDSNVSQRALIIESEPSRVEALTQWCITNNINYLLVDTPSHGLQHFWQAQKNEKPFSRVFVNPDLPLFFDGNDTPLDSKGLAKIIGQEVGNIPVIAFSMHPKPQKIKELGYSNWVDTDGLNDVLKDAYNHKSKGDIRTQSQNNGAAFFPLLPEIEPLTYFTSSMPREERKHRHKTKR